MPFTKYSWTVFDDTYAVKRTDMSVFKNHGSVVPKEFRDFFGIGDMEPGETRRITLVFEGEEFRGKFDRVRSTTRITRIFWDSALSTGFNAMFPDVLETKAYPDLQFRKVSDDRYELEFLDGVKFEEGQANLGADNLENKVDVFTKEGQRTVYYSTRYERSGKNRAAAIKLHGLKCMACGFDFESVYGERGRNYIEVHHIVPLSKKNGPAVVDPETDLICVCSNCHRMIHRSKDHVLSLDELKSLIAPESKS